MENWNIGLLDCCLPARHGAQAGQAGTLHPVHWVEELQQRICLARLSIIPEIH